MPGPLDEIVEERPRSAPRQKRASRRAPRLGRGVVGSSGRTRRTHALTSEPRTPPQPLQRRVSFEPRPRTAPERPLNRHASSHDPRLDRRRHHEGRQPPPPPQQRQPPERRAAGRAARSARRGRRRARARRPLVAAARSRGPGGVGEARRARAGARGGPGVGAREQADAERARRRREGGAGAAALDVGVGARGAAPAVEAHVGAARRDPPHPPRAARRVGARATRALPGAREAARRRRRRRRSMATAAP